MVHELLIGAYGSSAECFAQPLGAHTLHTKSGRAIRRLDAIIYCAVTQDHNDSWVLNANTSNAILVLLSC